MISAIAWPYIVALPAVMFVYGVVLVIKPKLFVTPTYETADRATARQLRQIGVVIIVAAVMAVVFAYVREWF
jgi:hypothetical protein